MTDDTPAEERVMAHLAHRKNITVGKARVIWAMGCTSTDGIAHAPGWVLPGGRRTLHEVEAHMAALVINSLHPM